jgi:hypothetical protein
MGGFLFLYRECFERIVGWTGAAVRGDSDQRFLHETRLWYFAGFLRMRFKTDVLHASRHHASGVEPDFVNDFRTTSIR